MDASDGGRNNGNGDADPTPVSLPSDSAAPSGAPAEPQGGKTPGPADPGCASAGAPDVPRRKNGQFAAGNPGRRPGVPNRNTELHRLFNAHELAKVKKLAIKAASEGNWEPLEFLLAHVLIKLTPEAAGVSVHVSQSNHQSVTSANVADAPEYRDPAVVGLAADLVDRLAAGRGKSVAAGHDRN